MYASGSNGMYVIIETVKLDWNMEDVKEVAKY